MRPVLCRKPLGHEPALVLVRRALTYKLERSGVRREASL